MKLFHDEVKFKIYQFSYTYQVHNFDNKFMTIHSSAYFTSLENFRYWLKRWSGYMGPSPIYSPYRYFESPMDEVLNNAVGPMPANHEFHDGAIVHNGTEDRMHFTIRRRYYKHVSR